MHIFKTWINLILSKLQQAYFCVGKLENVIVEKLKNEYPLNEWKINCSSYFSQGLGFGCSTSSPSGILDSTLPPIFLLSFLPLHLPYICLRLRVGGGIVRPLRRRAGNWTTARCASVSSSLSSFPPILLWFDYVFAFFGTENHRLF